MQSDKYGDIADITRGFTVVLPGKVVQLRPLPSTSTGPSVREMIIGSEGRLGVITEAWVHVHALPENRDVEIGRASCRERVEREGGGGGGAEGGGGGGMSETTNSGD